MGILNVIHGILVRATAKYIYIHHHGSIDWVANQGVASGIDSNFFNQLFQGDDGASALAEL